MELWRDAPDFRALEQSLVRSETVQVNGLSGSARIFLLAALAGERPTALVVVSGLGQAEKLREELAAWLSAERLLVFPALELLPYEVLARNPEPLSQRLKVFERLVSGEGGVIIAPVAAALGRVPPFGLLRSGCFVLRRGEEVEPQALLRRLADLGYERRPVVEGRGQCALRGDILDLFVPTAAHPWRLELFDRTVESLRGLDPETQRSTDQDAAQILVSPAVETVLDAPTRERGLTAVRQALVQAVRQLTRTGRGREAHQLEERVEEDLLRLEAGRSEGLERYARYFYPAGTLLIDYLPPQAPVFLDEPRRLEQAAEAYTAEVTGRYLHQVRSGQLLPGQSDPGASFGEFSERLAGRAVCSLAALPGQGEGRVVSFVGRGSEAFHGQWDVFLEELRRHLRTGHRVLVAASDAGRRRRLGEALAEEGMAVGAGVPGPGELALTEASIEGGFYLADLSLWVVTDAEIFGRPRRHRRAQGQSAGISITRHEDLKPGDFVVHESHGVARYLGIRTLEVGGLQRDYLSLAYQGEDRLYVPTDQIGLIQKYVGGEDREPKLSRLGGGEWTRVKNRVRESVREMAQELLRLYALREALPGHAFPPDTPWQKEFEDAFPYEETPDQQRSVAEIKADMEKSRPMDRLLCGDVGFGKTEVALRAAFKAIQDGKQVAFLVPTTILAQQHLATCRSRFAGWPVRVDMLSRFRSPAEQRAVRRAVREGEVDLLIGTHRMVQRDVRFRDLGLLIIDEEQRFGVEHKERLKRLRENVDCLTLTATPIPRTLHMSLAGMRDMSIIETPPEGRFPIQTYVVEHNDELVRDALLREMNRGGQAYYVHNRVQTIERVHRRLRELLPEARVALAHGQMPEDELERTMLDFLDGAYDVLLCTTIVESGLDMPRVNTLVAEDADRLGLAQLYQLRGRIGRSHRLAYAYFTYRRDKALTEVAQKRLEAVREFTELGSGFRIAMRDLELRGAGNILGPEQHGFIVSVGFELYRQLLEEAVAEVRGAPREGAAVATVVELPVDAYIPDQYVGDSAQKIEAYKHIAALRTLEEAAELAEELRDRFGPLPPPVENLLRVARIRIRGETLGLSAVAAEGEQVVLRLATLERLPGEKLRGAGGAFRGRVSFHAGKAPFFALRVAGLEPGELLATVEEFLGFLGEEARSA
ncbi:MAG: transcription-repair coupling factor [Thermaerobacter sp.]|nr:transcription-repair coupling factor [Thermaerobacter sp.]